VCIQYDNIKMDIVKLRCKLFDGLHLVMDRVEWRAHSKASINFLIPQNDRIFGQVSCCEILKKESASCSWLLIR
jgi:hypothetical protein